ncbi:MAG: oligosaccharide flippase family protein, partial [Gammaproteobacteria bacterium]|nr:oligosaccharide flippase family protein [Gammaproteobacteria bacterium]
MSMTEGKQDSASTAAPSDDRTGRDRMVRNVFASWAGYSVLVVTGFILPRIIDNSLGQVSLGIWDFGWSLASYFSIAQLGIGSSVNRYVAKYRMEGDTDAMNRSVSSVMSVQLVAALLALLATALTAWNLPVWFGERLGANVIEAQWVLLLLGSAISLQLGFDAFNGIMTGCHRWDLHNGINAGFHASSALFMIIVLWSGGGLRELAAVYLVALVITEIIRVFLVFRICPELRLNRRLVELRRTWEMFVFGSKTLLGGFSELLVYQTSHLLIVAFLGPAALALFARPLALVRHVFTFVQKFSFILTPTVSSLLAKGRQEEVRELFLTSVRYGAHLALPPILGLAMMGGAVLD